MQKLVHMLDQVSGVTFRMKTTAIAAGLLPPASFSMTFLFCFSVVCVVLLELAPLATLVEALPGCYVDSCQTN